MKNEDSKSMYGELSNCCENIQVNSSSESAIEISARFRFTKDYVGFKGHFPGHPVLPAIAQLALVRFVSEKGLTEELKPAQFNRVKFTGMVEPEDTIVVSVNLLQQNNGWGGQFIITKNDGTKTSSGEINFSI